MASSKKISLRVRGASKSPVISGELEGLRAPRGVKVTASRRIVLGSTRAATRSEKIDVDVNDLACVEFTDGFKLWTRVDDLRNEFARPARGERGGRDDVWEFDPQLGTPAQERGAAKVVVQALEFFDIDVAGMTAQKLSDWYEGRQLDKRGEGIYRIRFGGELALTPVPDGGIDAGGPVMLFLHGTASSTAGSFGDLWQAPEGATEQDALNRDQLFARLNDSFGERIYAFEHRTLTKGPIENALELVRQLPDGAELHLVSHSRGGLVGELLALGELAPGARLPDKRTLDRLFDPASDLSDLLGTLSDDGAEEKRASYAAQRQQLDDLLDLLRSKGLTIKRFLRVACPARGTTLASGRLDRWLSVLEYLGGETFAGDLIYFLLGVIKKRTDPRTLPGLEAMMPHSALVRLLNHSRIEVESDLSVIAGDLRADSLWRRLKFAITDWFYAGDHDLVVNTGSMYGGLRRSDGLARHLFDPGAKVHHFRYFVNASTSDRLLLGLAGDLSAFEDIAKAEHKDEIPIARDSGEETRAARPVAIVLPGTMGSSLSVDNDKVWLDYWSLAFGGLEKLRVKRNDAVNVGGLLNDFYGDFVVYLRKSHRVETYPYDWRKSVGSAVDGLARLIERLLGDCELSGQPLRLIAHSMGGLVARLTLARHPQLWKRIRALPGSCLLMLGTPNRGSHEAVRWLTGFNPTLSKLRLLDVTNGRDGLLEIVSRYPGLLELLPSQRGDTDFAAADFWSGLKDDLDESWPLPTATDLDRLHGIWDELAAAPADPEYMMYVAGVAPTTVNDFEVDMQADFDLLGNPVPRLRFFATSRGDGTVTWASGVLPGVRTWYVDGAQHDELLTHAEAFPAYLDLLQTRNTTRLPDAEPQAKRGLDRDGERIPLPTVVPDSIPGEDDMRGMVFGGGRVSAARPERRPMSRVTLSVRHGDLAYANSPVCVGHYAGDTIVSAERALDRGLNGALQERASLGLYPDAVGTHHVFIHPDQTVKPGGALIVGLGEVGSLSPGRLELALVQAFLDYASEVAHWTDERFGPSNVVRHARINCLLIGTGFDNMTVRDSVTAILRAVRIANERLHQHDLDKKVLIDEVTILELYEDIAIQAARELALVLDTDEFREQFEWPVREVSPGVAGHRRVLFEEAPNWWHRLEIVYDAQRELLRYHAFTDRARVEESLVAGEMRLAEDFITDTIASTHSDPKVAKTLFEMLVPNRLKQQAPDRRDVVLVVDKVSARFPWELMEDRWSHDGQPLAVAAGMLRQLKVREQSEDQSQGLDMNALVIGDPYLGADLDDVDDAYPRLDQLQGAYDEAVTVDRTLRQNGYDSTAVIRKDAREILIGLHANSYRILHLAGHGIHELLIPDDDAAQAALETDERALPGRERRISGMAIGHRRFLTPGDVQQMRVVPQLVFINCCHLGKTLGTRKLSRLAANLGVQFMQMGVRAVVAAGWAVDDAAAERFAKTFYQAMFDGETFGDAVRMARAEVWQRHPGSNTWGAYQCYGDPGFRLETGGRPRRGPRRDFVSPAELVVELRNLTSRVKTSGTDDQTIDGFVTWVDSLIGRIPVATRDAWLARAEVCEALGIVYGELGRFEDALRHLDKALRSGRADLSVTAIEQRANFRVRAAAARAKALAADGTDDGERLDAVLEEADREIAAAIDDLIRLCSFAPTAEREALLGSAYKRRAQVAVSDDAIATYLKGCADHYNASYELRRNDDQRVSYPLTQWRTAQVLANMVGRRNLSGMLDDDLIATVDTDCAGIIKRAAVHERRAPDFWNTAVPTDCLVLKALARLEFDRSADDIVNGYLRAQARGGSPRELRSVREHLEFLHDMLAARALRFGSRSDTAKRLNRQLTAINGIVDRLGLHADATA